MGLISTRLPQRGIAGKPSPARQKWGKSRVRKTASSICWFAFNAYSPKAVNPFAESLASLICKQICLQAWGNE